MITVWKYALPADPVFKLEMPAGAEILHVDVKQQTVISGSLEDGPMGRINEWCLWARVDSEAPTQVRTFEIVGTGSIAPASNEARHVGTFLVDHGLYVFHLFERRVPPGWAPLGGGGSD